MTPEQSSFRVGVIKPFECIKEGYALIKDQYWIFFGLALVAMFLGGAVPIVLMGAMMSGLFLCFFEKMAGRPFEFGLLFKGFDYFVPGLVVTAIKMIPIIIIIVPYYIILMATMMTTMPRGQASPEDMSRFVSSVFGFEIFFGLTIVIVSMCVEIFFMFAYPLIADRKLSGLDAIKLSIKAGKANFGGILGLIVLNALFGFLGVFLCIVGVYLYIPIAFAAQAVAYRKVFPEVAQTFPAPPPPPPSSWA